MALAFAASLLVWYLVRVPYSHGLVRAAEPALAAAIDVGPMDVVKVDDGVLVVNTGVPSGRGPGRMSTLRYDGLLRLGWPVMLLWTLIAVTSPRRLRRLWPWVLLAGLGVFGAEALTLVLEILKQVGAFRFERGLPFLGSDRHRTIVLSGEYLQVIAPVVPIALYLPVLLRRIEPASTAAFLAGSPGSPGCTGPEVARNEPCPCGSGAKFKRCCGATA